MPLFRVQALTARASSPLPPSPVSLRWPWPFPLSLARSYTSFQGCGGNGWWDLTTIELKSTIGSTQTVRAAGWPSGRRLQHCMPCGRQWQLEHPEMRACPLICPAASLVHIGSPSLPSAPPVLQVCLDSIRLLPGSSSSRRRAS